MDSDIRSDYYVYFHRDLAGSIFYVGKGTKRRAHSRDRHPAWTTYVAERLMGEYTVEIHAAGLTEEQADDMEWMLICEHGNHLINWFNPGRSFDYEAIRQYHVLRDRNRVFVDATRPYESTDPERAIERYRRALDAMRSYESIVREHGVVADMKAGPTWGEPKILDRLTLCLAKLGRYEEVVDAGSTYFNDFPSARNLAAGRSILSRIEKAKSRIAQSATSAPSTDPPTS